MTDMTALTGWENFYVIVGSSAGALIGLQFVVITLIADMPIAVGQAQAGDAFATPTIVHFGAVLLLSAISAALGLAESGLLSRRENLPLCIRQCSSYNAARFKLETG